MMGTSFKTISSEIIIEGELKTVYGIEAAGENVLRIYNLNVNKALVDELVDKCNKLSLSSIHIKDVCEDFLVSNS